MIRYMHVYLRDFPYSVLPGGTQPLLTISPLDNPDDPTYPAVALDEDSQAELLLLYSIGNP